MIRDTTAQRIAAEWHGGQSSALYALSSTGAIFGERNEEWDYNDAANEINKELSFIDTEDARDMYPDDIRDLRNLLSYVRANGPRPAVPDWYNRVIRKADR